MNDGLTLSPNTDLEVLLKDSLGVELRLCHQKSTLDLNATPASLDLDLLPALRGNIGPTGPQGPPGSVQLTGSVIAAVNMLAGTPVYIKPSDNKLYPADNTTAISSRVVGLLTENVLSGFIGVYDRATLVLPDWSAIVGSVSLSIGQYYFLSAAGTLTTASPGTGTNTRIGEAVDFTKFNVFPTIIPILL